MRRRRAPTFWCGLDELLARRPYEVPERLRVNRGVRVQVGSAPPAELALRARHLEAFRRGCPLLWVPQPGTQVMTPYWVPPEWAMPVIDSVQGRRSPATLEEPILSALAATGVLVDDTSDGLQAAADQMLEEASSAFASSGHVNIPGLLAPLALVGLKRYYEQQVELLVLGDAQCSTRYGRHNERLAQFWHGQLLHAVARLTGEAVKPSYSYLAAYVGGSQLDAHRDREQCEFTISLLLDAHPLRDGRSTWPLWLEDDSGKTAVYQAPGDGLLFRGRELTHWRERLDDEARSTSLLLHYVPADFSGPLE